MSDEQPTYDEVGLAEAIFAVEQAIDILGTFDISTSQFEATLTQLKCMQDKWYEAKQAMKAHLENGGHRVKSVAQYAKHLEQELANRKPVWIVVPVDGDEMSDDLTAASEVGMDHPVQKLQKQNLALKIVVKDIWWMAQRYANGRCTYAPTMYNLAIDFAIKNGFKPDSKDVYAEDGDLGKWIPGCQCFERERIK